LTLITHERILPLAPKNQWSAGLSWFEMAGVPDNGPVIVGVTWFLTLLCGAFLALRIYAKVSRKQGLWWDDHILILSWVRFPPSTSAFPKYFLI
jgi:hypothetical protein